MKITKEPIRVWIPVLVKEKGSKQLLSHPENKVYIKGQEYDVYSSPEPLIVSFPNRQDAEYFLNDHVIKVDSEEYKYKGLAVATIPKGRRYTRNTTFNDGWTRFISEQIEILDQKLDYVEEINKKESLIDQEEKFYIITSMIDGEEYSHENKIVPGASQVVHINDSEIEKELKENNYDSPKLRRIYKLFNNREDAERELELESKNNPDHHRLRSVRVPDCCKVFTNGTSIFSNGIIPGREVLREIIITKKQDDVKVIENLSQEPTEESIREIKSTQKAEDKKSITEYVAYNSHVMLNPPYLTATSSITCIDSYQKWEKAKDRENYGENGFRDLLVEIADCRGKIRLHNRGGDLEDFIDKLVVLRGQLDLFIDHLRETKDPEEIIRKAKLKFPSRYGEI